MDKKTLQRYKPNKRELALIDKALDKLYDRLADVPEVFGKVSKSGDDFPYIEERVTVRMEEPKAASAIKKQIREKKRRKKVLLEENQEVEAFIVQLPEDSIEKSIFELVYLQGDSQQKVAGAIGYTQGRVSQIINNCLKD